MKGRRAILLLSEATGLEMWGLEGNRGLKASCVPSSELADPVVHAQALLDENTTAVQCGTDRMDTEKMKGIALTSQLAALWESALTMGQQLSYSSQSSWVSLCEQHK